MNMKYVILAYAEEMEDVEPYGVEDWCTALNSGAFDKS